MLTKKVSLLQYHTNFLTPRYIRQASTIVYVLVTAVFAFLASIHPPKSPHFHILKKYKNLCVNSYFCILG
jgi:hypothetical protein